MLTEFALLKLQTINGEEQFVHKVPVLLSSKRSRESKSVTTTSQHIEILPTTNILNTFPYHAMIYYSEGTYRIAAITPLLVNSSELSPSKVFR